MKTAQGTSPPFTKPGLHSYNIRRKQELSEAKRRGFIGWLKLLLLSISICALSYYGYTLANRYVYQAYENWAFDQEIAGRQMTFRDWVMQTTPLGGWTGYRPPAVTGMSAPVSNAPSGEAAVPLPLAEGEVMGRVSIPRLNLSAIVRQGVDQDTLSRAVGHVPSTQAAGEIGNFAIAAHRDTLFRALKDIRIGDRIQFQSTDRTFEYQVISTKIVKPADVSVLRSQGDQRLLTMITCYPFYFVGSAPKRFIVTARLLPESNGVADRKQAAR